MEGATVNFPNVAHKHPCSIINHLGSLISLLSEDTITTREHDAKRASFTRPG